MHLLLHSVPPTLQQATTNPCLRRRLVDTPGQVWVSLLWGHCSFLLDPGVHKVLFVPFKSLFPQFCVSSGRPYGGVIGHLLQEGLCHTQVCCTQPYPGLLQLEPLPLWQSTADPYLHRIHSNTVLSVSVVSLGPGVHKVCLIPLSISGRNEALL